MIMMEYYSFSLHWLQYLFKSIMFLWKELILKDYIPIPPYLKEVWPSVDSSSSFCMLHNLSHCCKASTFRCSSMFQETKHFDFWMANWTWMYKPRGIFAYLMWKSNIKGTNITKLAQMIFTAWFEYFEHVGSITLNILK